MHDLRQYTKRFMMEFIDLYKRHPALWEIRNKDYRNREKKAAAYQVLVDKCREVEPGCTKMTVIKKINSLRTCYRKELNKCRNYKRNGVLYKPKLWYFNLLSFLYDDVGEETNDLEDELTYADVLASETVKYDPLTDDEASEDLNKSSDRPFDLGQYTQKFLSEVIELYKSLPALWQVKSRDYRDKEKKAAAYEILIKKCREVEPECQKDTVVKKINSLRTCYRKELNKVRRSAEKGKVYRPRLWYYDLLSFLNEETVVANDALFLDEDAANELFGNSETQSESARSSPLMFTQSEKPTKRKRLQEDESFMKHEDEFDLLGRIYANKLRRLDAEQRIYAEKIINDALFEAQLGNLNRNCRLVVDLGRRNETSASKSAAESINCKEEIIDSNSEGPPTIKEDESIGFM